MSTGWIIAIVIAVAIVLLAGGWLAYGELRKRRLRGRFGDEYDRTLEDRQGRRAAERELTEREKRHQALGIKPVSPMARDRYVRHWELIQAQFVDRPSTAVNEADRLVVSIMTERGYPEADYEERLAMLSVEHGPVLGHYRQAREIKTRHELTQVSTELLRTAMVHYRTLVEDLLDETGIGRRTPPRPEPQAEEKQVVASPAPRERPAAEERVEAPAPEPSVIEMRTEAPVPAMPDKRAENSSPQTEGHPA